MELPEKLKSRLQEMVRGTKGSRFQDRYHRVHAAGGNVILRKAMFLGGGFVVVCAGIFFLPAPGPGMVIVAIGAGMIAQESLALAKVLDKLEVRGTRVFVRARSKWRKLPAMLRTSVVVLAAACAAGFMYLSYVVLIR